MFVGFRSAFFRMIALLGASIGVLTALTVTSTSNTVIELIGGILAGGAGLYVLLDTDLSKRARLEEIGLLGVSFLFAFWVGWAGGKAYIYLTEDGFLELTAVEDAAIDRILVSEISAHGRALGMPGSVQARLIDQAVSARTGTAKCETALATESALLDAINLLGGINNACATRAEKDAVLSMLFEMTGGLRKQLNNKDADVAAQARSDLVGAFALWHMALESGLATPVRAVALGCEDPAPDATQRVRDVLARHFETCHADPLFRLARDMRGAAQGFAGIWGGLAPERKRNDVEEGTQ